MSDVRIESHVPELNRAMQDAINNTLELLGQVAEGRAVVNVPVDTGNLKQSITHRVAEDENAVYIGTNVEYAPYVEYGTGVFASEGGGRRTPWKYVASPSSKYYEGGKPHITQGQKPTHFLKRAITENQDLYRSIIQKTLRADLQKFLK